MIKVSDMNIIKTLPIIILGILSSSFFIVKPTKDNPSVIKKVHHMGFQKLEVNDSIISINDPTIFNNVDTHLVSIFHKIESDYGKPLKIKWGYRDPSLNRKAGGARNSAHIYGKALDIYLDYPSKESIKKLIVLATKYNVLGLGVYSDARTLHIDIDSTKGRRVWGSSYSSYSIPSWARSEIKSHISTGIVTEVKEVKTVPPVKVVVNDKPVYYTIKKGDTAYRVSKDNGISVDSLYKLNNNKIRLFIVGQKIRVR
jgi:LysM repeat protein